MATTTKVYISIDYKRLFFHTAYTRVKNIYKIYKYKKKFIYNLILHSYNLIIIFFLTFIFMEQCRKMCTH